MWQPVHLSSGRAFKSKPAHCAPHILASAFPLWTPKTRTLIFPPHRTPPWGQNTCVQQSTASISAGMLFCSQTLTVPESPSTPMLGFLIVSFKCIVLTLRIWMVKKDLFLVSFWQRMPLLVFENKHDSNHFFLFPIQFCYRLYDCEQGWAKICGFSLWLFLQTQSAKGPVGFSYIVVLSLWFLLLSRPLPN